MDEEIVPSVSEALQMLKSGQSDEALFSPHKLNELLYELRISEDMSTSQVAKLLRCNDGTISKYERGELSLSHRQLLFRFITLAEHAGYDVWLYMEKKGENLGHDI